MRWSEKQQRYFYFNHQNNSSQWEAPANVTGQSQGDKSTKLAKEQTKPGENVKIMKKKV